MRIAWLASKRLGFISTPGISAADSPGSAPAPCEWAGGASFCRLEVAPMRQFWKMPATYILSCLVLLFTSLGWPQDAAKPTAPSTGSDANARSADYVGSEVCVTCHSEQQKSFEHTIMGNALMAHPKTSQEKLGCEACHGPGKAHVDAGGGKDTIPIRFTKDSNTPVEERNSACLSCHTKGNQMFWAGSAHESRAMACVDCHQVHYGSVAERYAALANLPSKEGRYGQPLTEHVGTKKTQPELCLQCHQMRRAQLQRSSHMPYRE
jgi:Cytochrome c-type protein NrfB-like